MHYYICLGGSNRTAIDLAKEKNKWSMYFSMRKRSLGNLQKEKYSICKNEFEKANSVCDNWLNIGNNNNYKLNDDDNKDDENENDNELNDESENGNNNNNEFMDQFVYVLCELISSFKPISDEMLLIGFKYNSSKIWNIISNVLSKILNIPFNPLYYTYFQLYLANSFIWYFDKNKYNELINMVDKLIENNQQNAFIDPINKLKEDDSNSFNELINYAQMGLEDIIRQDKYILPIFSYSRLLSIKLNSGYDSINRENINSYISQLILTGNELNKIMICGINNIYLNDKSIYAIRFAPIKNLERMSMKAETKYSGKKYPSSAHILDVIRCSITCKKPKDLINAINKFKDAINNSQTCFAKIVRIKNLYDKNNAYSYFDIKINAIIKDKKNQFKKIIMEVQFLLDCIIKAKKSTHKAYGITRNKEFITFIADSCQIDKQQTNESQFFSHINTSNINFPKLYECIINNNIDVRILENEGNLNKTVLMYGLEKGNGKLIEFLLSNDLSSKIDKFKYAIMKNQVCIFLFIFDDFCVCLSYY